MVANAGLDNEKSALNYQVELLKDRMEEAEEQAAIVAKELRVKNQEYSLLKRSHAETQRAVQILQVMEKFIVIASSKSLNFKRRENRTKNVSLHHATIFSENILRAKFTSSF